MSGFERTPSEEASYYAGAAMADVARIVETLYGIKNGKKVKLSLIEFVNAWAKQTKTETEQKFAAMGKEIEDLKRELRKAQLSAIMTNPIMYDEQARKVAQEELQSIMDAEAEPKLADMFK